MRFRLSRWLIVALVIGGLAGVCPDHARAGGPAPEPAASSDLAIVVNKENPVESLSMSELRKVFLGERSHWPSGRRITLVMMEPGHPERAALIRDVCQMNESDFSRHFLHGVFTGEVFVSPKTLASPVGVRKFIFNVPGAIGYLRVSDVDSSVKIVRVDGHLPAERDYGLHLQARAKE
jgi:ABC-type phosphate transport system substrate-binding protein